MSTSSRYYITPIVRGARTVDASKFTARWMQWTNRKQTNPCEMNNARGRGCLHKTLRCGKAYIVFLALNLHFRRIRIIRVSRFRVIQTLRLRSNVRRSFDAAFYCLNPISKGLAVRLNPQNKKCLFCLMFFFFFNFNFDITFNRC